MMVLQHDLRSENGRCLIEAPIVLLNVKAAMLSSHNTPELIHRRAAILCYAISIRVWRPPGRTVNNLINALTLARCASNVPIRKCGLRRCHLGVESEVSIVDQTFIGGTVSYKSRIMLASISQPTVLSFQQYYGFKTLAMAFIARILLAFVLAAVTANAAVDKAQGVAIGHSKDAAQACFGDATPFLLPGDPGKTVNCCIAPWSVTWFDQNAQIGECCAPGQSWSGNRTTLVGGCCDRGQDWSQDKSSGLGGCCAPSMVFVGDKATKTGGCCTAGMIWLNGKCAPPPPRPTCKDLADPVCGDDDDLGIQYGHCYILKFADGTQLGADHAAPTYSKDGFFKDIPFKVCRSATDCALGEVVPTDGTFLLQDQMGRPEDATGAVGWVDNGAGGTHIKFNTNGAQAGVFKGVAACSGGKCFIRLGGGPTGNGSIGPTCPVPEHGLTFWPNPKATMLISFTETACSGPDAPFVPINAANPAQGLLGAFGASRSRPAVAISQRPASSLVASAAGGRVAATAATVARASSAATARATAPSRVSARA